MYKHKLAREGPRAPTAAGPDCAFESGSYDFSFNLGANATSLAVSAASDHHPPPSHSARTKTAVQTSTSSLEKAQERRAGRVPL